VTDARSLCGHGGTLPETLWSRKTDREEMGRQADRPRLGPEGLTSG
jgi:hypothetical protein